MDRLNDRVGCAVPTEVLKSLLLVGIAGAILISSARLVGLGIPHNLVVGLVGFFLVGAVLALQGLSILRKPGLVLLVGTTSIVSMVQFQHEILSLL